MNDPEYLEQAVRTPRCILIEPPRHRVTDDMVGAYGTLHVLFPEAKPTSPWDVATFQECTVDALEDMFYAPGEDYLVLVGSVLMIAHLVWSAGQVGSTIKALAHHPADGGSYRPVELGPDLRVKD